MLVDHSRYQGVLLLVDTNMYLPYTINVNYFFNEVTYIQHSEQNDKQDFGLWFLPQTNFGPDIAVICCFIEPQLVAGSVALLVASCDGTDGYRFWATTKNWSDIQSYLYFWCVHECIIKSFDCSISLLFCSKPDESKSSKSAFSVIFQGTICDGAVIPKQISNLFVSDLRMKIKQKLAIGLTANKASSRRMGVLQKQASLPVFGCHLFDI